jgi:hypothetical protein
MDIWIPAVPQRIDEELLRNARNQAMVLAARIRKLSSCIRKSRCDLIELDSRQSSDSLRLYTSAENLL